MTCRDGYEVAGRSPHTISAIRLQVMRLARSRTEAGLPDDVSTLTRADVQQFLAKERRRGLAEASLSIAQRSIRRFSAYALERGYTTVDASKGIPSITVSPKPVRFLDDEQMTALMRSLEKDRSLTGRRDYALLSLAGDTGMRRGELLGLTLPDLDLTNRTVAIRPETSKARRPRVAAFSAPTALALRDYLRLREAYMDRVGMVGDYLWVGAKRERLQANGALQMLRRRCTAAGVPVVSLHSFRHRMAATAIRDGVATVYLMTLGGWSSPQMLGRYGAWDAQRNALDAAHARFAGQAGKR